MNAPDFLPADLDDALLVGRVWRPAPLDGPAVVAVRRGRLVDISAHASTVAGLLERSDAAAIVRGAPGEDLGDAAQLVQGAAAGPASGRALRLLAPCDLQAIKACGLRPQDMDAGVKPDTDVVTKSQPMSALGHGADIGLQPATHAHTPEAGIVLAVNSLGLVVGAALGNDIRLGDTGDDTGSCAIGPFIRLFDRRFTMDTLRRAEVHLRVDRADDGIVLTGASRMREIGREPLDLVEQTCGHHHQYPDGFMLFLGTTCAPGADRGVGGAGFTHHPGDRVSISAASLGTLVNTVRSSDGIVPWTYGARCLYASLARRGLLAVA